ncbi:MAG TPA: aminotransferase class V-fold PLP-dependent enzyme, partial [Candidatus Methanomethylicus sp.]|nr:aminotransferase class V-fold PLP-dependent enzyme [Candidatus Methanomethylicus sp.]
MSQERVSYLDNASYSPMDPRVLEAMLPFFRERYGNPSSPHAKGSEMKAALEGARAKVASLIGAEHPAEIIFTSGSTEGTNTAIRGVATRNRERG